MKKKHDNAIKNCEDIVTIVLHGCPILLIKTIKKALYHDQKNRSHSKLFKTYYGGWF